MGMKQQVFTDVYHPIGGRFYAQRYSNSLPSESGWIIYGIDKYWHYIVAHGLSWFFAKLYVERLNRIARLCAGDDVFGRGYIRHYIDYVALAKGEVEI